MGDIVGSSLSWRWAKAGCEWWAVSWQLMASAERGGQCERGGHYARNDRDELSDPVETVDLALTAGWHHVWAEFGRAPQGCLHELG